MTPLGLMGLIVGVTACGGGGLAGDRIAQSIQADVIKQGGTSLKAVTCPKTIKPEAGASFECIGEIESGYTFTIAVKQSDDQGNVVWDVPSAKGLLNVAKLQTLIQESLQAELGARPVVACGGTYKPVKPGQTFDCQLDYQPSAPKQDAGKASKPGKGKSEKIVVTIDPQNNLSWQRVLPNTGSKVAAAIARDQAAPLAAPAANPAAAPPAKASAEEFLNQPNATESLED